MPGKVFKIIRGAREIVVATSRYQFAACIFLVSLRVSELDISVFPVIMCVGRAEL